MTTTQRARANTKIAIEHVIVARAGRLPADIDLIASIATLSFNPAIKMERLNRMDHIMSLISETLVEAGI
jgi:hypothetical protein